MGGSIELFFVMKSPIPGEKSAEVWVWRRGLKYRVVPGVAVFGIVWQCLGKIGGWMVDRLAKGPLTLQTIV
jgi:hypothetical protein